jgi:hypothetical protein
MKVVRSLKNETHPSIHYNILFIHHHALFRLNYTVSYTLWASLDRIHLHKSGKGKCQGEMDGLGTRTRTVSFGTTNLYGTSSRTIGRSRTLPSIGMELSNAQFSLALSPPKLDPYQEWLILNQSRLEAEEEKGAEPTLMALECMSAASVSGVLTPTTPPLFSRQPLPSPLRPPLPHSTRTTAKGRSRLWISTNLYPGNSLGILTRGLTLRRLRGMYSAKLFEYVDGKNVQEDMPELDTVRASSRSYTRAGTSLMVSGKSCWITAIVEDGNTPPSESRGPTFRRVSRLKDMPLPPLSKPSPSRPAKGSRVPKRCTIMNGATTIHNHSAMYR